MNITAKQLQALTKPLFKKHPSAKPGEIQWKLPGYTVYEGNEMFASTLAIIIQGHLAEWLSVYVNKLGYDLEVEVYNGKFIIKADCKIHNMEPTLLKALVSACMKAPSETPNMEKQ